MIAITYVYENESFAREMFDNLQIQYRSGLKNVYWSRLDKRIETTDILIRFIHHTALTEGYRGMRHTYVYFEKSLEEKLTDEQFMVAFRSVRNYDLTYGCITLDRMNDLKRKEHEEKTKKEKENHTYIPN